MSKLEILILERLLNQLKLLSPEYFLNNNFNGFLKETIENKHFSNEEKLENILESSYSLFSDLLKNIYSSKEDLEVLLQDQKSL